jgi:hypothetical protein
MAEEFKNNDSVLDIFIPGRMDGELENIDKKVYIKWFPKVDGEKSENLFNKTYEMITEINGMGRNDDIIFILCDRNLEKITDIIKEYLSNNKLDNHNLPQYMFVTDSNKQLIPNIIILHTETLTSDMRKLNYKHFNNHDNKNKISINYYKYLNQNSIKLINDFYDYDFTLFNYKKLT